MKYVPLAAALALAVVASCKPREEILPGTRYDIDVPLADTLPAEDGTPAPVPAAAADLAVKLSLPGTVSPGSWENRGLGARHDMPHLAFSSAPQLRFAVTIGEGNSKRTRITANPVVAGGRIFTLDSTAGVVATSTAGEMLWAVNLTPSSDRVGEASGGGLSLGDGRLYVATGFGTMVALDPATGKQIWSQKLAGVAAASPTYFDGLIYTVTRSGQAMALRADDGRIAWEIATAQRGETAVGGAGVAIDPHFAVIPFASGEMRAVLPKSGTTIWSAYLAGERRGRAYTIAGGIIGDPIIRGDTLYAANASGRLMAADTSSGERLWTAKEGALSTPVVAGGSIFLVSDALELVRLDAGTGERIWGTKLPDFTTDKVKRRSEVFAHFGPLLAGGRLIVASGDGLLRSFDPTNGALLGSVEIPGGAATDPVIVGGTLYLVSAEGQLLAFK